MQSPTMHEPANSRTPKSNFNPILAVGQPNRLVDGWRETCHFPKPEEEDELAGFIFDPELLREGSD